VRIGQWGQSGAYRWGVLAALLLTCGGWRGTPGRLVAQVRPRPARATPAPPFVMDSAGILRNPAAVIRYIGTLSWATGPEASDRRFLMLKDTAAFTYTVGPRAMVAPESGATLVARGWDQRGRVLARVTLSGDYPPLHLKKDTTYVCVRNMVRDSALATLIGLNNGSVTSVGSLRLRVYHLRNSPPTIARFTFDPKDDGYCFPCNTAWCCAET
jgi:hypothetical protein